MDVILGGINHCDSQQIEHKYGVPVNTGVSLSMCAVSYPTPTQFSLHFSGKPVLKQRYKISYTYTNEISARGTLVIKIFNLTEVELGIYQVQNDKGFPPQALSFQLTAKGPPLCPENLTALYVGENIVSLSWTPGFNGGLVQSFLVQDMTGGKLLTIISEHETLKETIVYNVTGLSANTNYSFSIDVENSEGRRTCPNVTVATPVIVNSPLSNYYFIQTVASAVCVILVILVAIVIITSVFVKKNRMRIGKRVRNADNKGIIEVDNNGSIYSLQNTFEASDGGVSHNVYNNQPTVKYFKSSQQDQAENVAIYCNAASAGTNNNMETENEGETAVYDEGSTGQVARQEQVVGRYRNQDGLVYVSVEINPQTTFPEIKGAKSDDVQEVSYADIQFHKN
ncbi:uncharacterized protein LOC131936207 [Physella acuta]|uniref:uncharacterized protein LOC131936207 n=1 Tax=Physella acuta TaxID=109671 RepID=UPI0027DD66BF|nr:uncharacterized protein LOC131936207 [Physella acuta]